MSIPDGLLDSAPREAQLVARARQGDGSAFGAIYQQYVDRVYSYVAFRVRDEALAEDLTQEVFLLALRSLDSFDWRGSLAPWLMRIARNAVIDHWRRAGRRPERAASALEATEGNEEEGYLDREASAEAAAALARIEEALDRRGLIEASHSLTDLQQQVLALRFASGLSIQETAEAMGKSEGAVKNLQHHALRSLRRRLLEGAIGD